MVSLEPLPETLSDYYKNAAAGQTGSRIKDPKKHLICGKTARSYMFWDNLIYHYKNLAPLFGKKIEFQEHVCPHDGWLYYEPGNLKLHNKVFKFEQAEATFVENRVNVDNPDWKPPCERRMTKYNEVEDGQEVKGVKRSRFLKREIKPIQTSRKGREEEEVQVVKKEKPLPAPQQYHLPQHKYDYPYDPDMLAPMPRPQPKKNPEYLGWTHSEDVDSWFLEAKTASQYDHYEKFYNEALKKRVICPKLYSSVC